MIKNKKSQAMVYDFIFGFIAFVIIFIAVTLIWFRTSGSISNDKEYENKLVKASHIANQLVKYPGEPFNWEYKDDMIYNNNFTIGLADYPNHISKIKLNTFLNASDDSIGYNRTKELLNIERYEYYLAIRDNSGNILNSTGIHPNENLSSGVQRKIYIDDNIRTFELTIH